MSKNHWVRLETDLACVVATTEKAVLLKIEGTDKKYWMPAKLVKFGNDEFAKVSFPPDFMVTIFMDEKGASGHYERVYEKTITVDDLLGLYPK